MDIRRVRPEEWEALRDVRLRALADAPSAFETRFEEAQRRPEEWWIEWAARSAHGVGQAMFLAWDGEDAVGIVGTYVEDDGNRWLISMWTEPERRGEGIGRALVETVAAFARASGSPELLLEVTHGNESAFALYRACGFEETGSGRPHSDDEPTRDMRLAL